MTLKMKGRVFTDRSGVYVDIPLLVNETGPLSALIQYFLYHFNDRSLAWMQKVCRSVSLFLDYCEANPSLQEGYIVFQTFSQRLLLGSFDRRTGVDLSELCWVPRRRSDVAQIVAHLNDFFDWISEEWTSPGLIDRSSLPVSATRIQVG